MSGSNRHEIEKVMRQLFGDAPEKEEPANYLNPDLDRKVTWPPLGRSMLGKSLHALFEMPEETAGVGINENAYAMVIRLWGYHEGTTIAVLSGSYLLSASEVDDGLQRLLEGDYIERTEIVRHSPDGSETTYPGYRVTDEFRASQERVLDEFEAQIEEGTIS